jgi:MFS family permease
MTNLSSRVASLTEGLPHTYWYLWIGTLINRTGGFVIPFLSLYLTSQRHIAISQAAAMVSLFGAGSFISQLIGGELTDRLGRRPVMLMSFLVAPLTMVTLGLMQTVLMIAICTFILGFFTDLYRPAVGAAIADLVAPAARPRAYGYNYWAINMGAAIAPILAGFLAHYTYLGLFIGDALTTFIAGMIVLFVVRETRPVEAEHTAQASLQQRISRLKSEPILLWFSFLALFVGSIYMQGMVTLPIDMQSHGLGPEQYGLAISINGFLIVLVSIPVSNMAVNWPRFRAMSIAALLLGLGFGFTAFASTLPLFALSVLIWTLGEITATAVAPAIIADLSPVALRGLYQGIFGSAWGLSFFIGPLVGGWIFQKLGPAYLWGGCFALACLLAIAYSIMNEPAKRRMARVSLPADE